MHKGIFLILLLSLSMLLCVPQVSANTSLTYDYDANGNLIQGDGKYYEYNDANQLVRVRFGDQNGPIIAEYVYDYTGQRVKKIENGVTTYYIGKHFETQVGDVGSGNTSYYFANGERVARKDSSGNISYYHSDHLGGTNVVTNSSGNLIERTTYYPFGEIREGGNEKYTYTGKERDRLTDLYYYEARYYNPGFVHFTQADTIVPNLYDPQNLNRYAYVKNSPLRFIDPTGHVWWNPFTWFKKKTESDRQTKSQTRDTEIRTSPKSCSSVLCRSNKSQSNETQTYIRQRSQEEIITSKKAELEQALKVEKYHKDATYQNVIKDEPSFNPHGLPEMPDIEQANTAGGILSAAEYIGAPYYVSDVNKQISQQADSILQEGGVEAADHKIQEVRRQYDPSYK